MRVTCLFAEFFVCVALAFLQAFGPSAILADDKSFKLLDGDLIAGLPDSGRGEWTIYLSRSRELANQERNVLAQERRQAKSQSAPNSNTDFEISTKDRPDDWFRSGQAMSLAESIVSFQTPSGGWSKAVDYSKGPRIAGMHWTSQRGNEWHYCGTFDNRSTTEQIRFLMVVYAATENEKVKQSALRGIEFVLKAQFPNGGWPQNFPVEPGYHEAITLNDNAMIHILELLLDVANGEGYFKSCDEKLRRTAHAAFESGIDCLAKMQVKIDGHPTVWCAQHHPITLEPVAARIKEPASLSGSESAYVVKFLMRKAPTSPDVISMVEPALSWFEKNRITNLRKAKNDQGKTDYVHDPNSTEVYWARFYDLKSGKPIFAGSDDGVVYDNFSEMASKNKVGYDYFTTRPQELLDKEVARWRKRLAKAK